jgi:hypothetical protein
MLQELSPERYRRGQGQDRNLVPHCPHFRPHCQCCPGTSSNDCFGIATDCNSEQQVVAASVRVGRAGLLLCCAPNSLFPYRNMTQEIKIRPGFNPQNGFEFQTSNIVIVPHYLSLGKSRLRMITSSIDMAQLWAD